MSGHTKGPWKARVNPDGGRLSVEGADGTAVVAGCGCCDSPWTDKAHAEANARLIAAAPDLLAACKALLQFEDAEIGESGGELEDSMRAVAMIRAAIAKAEGGA